MVTKILGAFANVVFTTGGINYLSLKYFVKIGVIAEKNDLKR